MIRNPQSAIRNLFAFTLIEMLTVLFLFSLLLGMTVFTVTSSRKQMELQSAARTVRAIFHAARSYAVRDRRLYQVIINDRDERAQGGINYGLKIYDPQNGSVDKWYRLSDLLMITATTFPKKPVPFPEDGSPPQEKPVVEFTSSGSAVSEGAVWVAKKQEPKKVYRIFVFETTGAATLDQTPP